MKKISILLLIVAIATGCAVGTYYPYAQNNFGAQSKVVLDKANFRIVRDVEAIINVDNTNLSRADVANSAYGELLRKAQLTGSQVLINVVIEEVRRETAGFFRLLLGMPKRVQYVAARATIIEFLDKDGNPTVSQSYRPSGTWKTENNLDVIAIVDKNYIEVQYNSIITKLNRHNWQNSVLCSSYKNAYNYLIEHERLEDVKKLNKVLLDIFNNKLIKTNVEKLLSQNLKQGIPEYQTFLTF